MSLCIYLHWEFELSTCGNFLVRPWGFQLHFSRVSASIAAVEPVVKTEMRPWASVELGWTWYVRVRGVTCPKIYELTPPHGTPLTPRPQELTPCANHHGTPALTDRFLDWFVIFLRDLLHFTSVREFFDLTPNVKERMAHLQIVFYQPKFSDVIPIVGKTYLISKNVIHDGFPHWHTEYIQVLR